MHLKLTHWHARAIEQSRSFIRPDLELVRTWNGSSCETHGVGNQPLTHLSLWDSSSPFLFFVYLRESALVRLYYT